MSTNDELIRELKDARLAVHRAAEARDEARFVYLEKKAAYAKAMGVVEEILMEIETGKTGRPLLDAANGAPRSGLDLMTRRSDSGPETNRTPTPKPERANPEKSRARKSPPPSESIRGRRGASNSQDRSYRQGLRKGKAPRRLIG